MNEDHKLQEILHRISSEVSASHALRSQVAETVLRRRRMRSRWPLALTGGLVGAASIAAGLLFLLPRSSTASAYRRVEDAIADAKTMRIRSYSETPGNARHLFSDLFYSNGNWRIDAFPGSPLARSYIKAGPDQWNYFENSDVAIQEPYAGNVSGGFSTALEFAKADTDEGQVNSERDFKVEPRPDLDHRPIYAVVATRTDTPYHLEMLVDKKTNLPIRATFSGESPTSPSFRLITREYSFGAEVSAEAFSPRINPTTKVLNLVAESNALKDAWKTPIKELNAGGTKVDVRDVQVNGDGEIFIACSMGRRTNPNDPAFPENLLPDSIVDDQGRAYELVDTVKPGGTFGDTRASEYLKFGDEPVAITEWAPLEPVTPWSAAKVINVHFVSRTWMGSPTYSDPSVTCSARIDLPKPMLTRFPAYSSSLLLDEVHLFFGMSAASDRGTHFEAKHNYVQAARWYREAANEAKPLTGYKRLEMKAEQIEKLIDPNALKQ